MSRGRYERKRRNKVLAIEAEKVWVEHAVECEAHQDSSNYTGHVPAEIGDWIGLGKPTYNVCILCRKPISRVWLDDRHVSAWFLRPYLIQETP